MRQSPFATVAQCRLLNLAKTLVLGCSTCGSHSCNQEELLNSDWSRACHTMSQHFPDKNPGKLPGDLLRTPNVLDLATTDCFCGYLQ